jgi:hypothetical protein
MMHRWRRPICQAAGTTTKISARSSTTDAQKMLEPPLSGDGKRVVSQTCEKDQL